MDATGCETLALPAHALHQAQTEVSFIHQPSVTLLLEDISPHVFRDYEFLRLIEVERRIAQSNAHGAFQL
jgi:hypothetical protein